MPVIFFTFFFLSGFCGLVYQVVWLRMAMADFGVTTPLISIVLSVFMAGLALGSWGGGKLVRRFNTREAPFFVRLYAASELAIGISGLLVAPLLKLGRGSATGYLASGAWISCVMLPFCTCMGATFPLAMAGTRKSFSFLYVANVLGAMAGALTSAFVLIELLGFSKTLLIAATMNGAVAATAFAIAGRISRQREKAPAPATKPAGERFILPFLFLSGLSSLGMEVVWTRQFVPLLGPVVYCFATILTVYLLATAVGSQTYRARMRFNDIGKLMLLAFDGALLPLWIADPRIPMRHQLLSPAVRVSYGIGIFCIVLGFLTPMLVDRWSSGDPNRAGRAYAVNALGCIVGPLLSGFVLLPAIGERWTLVVLALPFFVFGLRNLNLQGRLLAVAVAIAAFLLIAQTRDFETLYPEARVRRDHTATVIAAGQAMDKKLLVNGMGITNLTPITKMMVHLPLAFRDRPPTKVLVLCFGMGTSFRSALSWGVPVTVVELVPSVPSLFSYFHADGDELLRSPLATVVIDDARRYLERTEDTFDAVVIDPPPPVEAAASSLLYSQEFYELARRRLRPGGILQQWLPGGEPIVVSAFAQALGRGFPNVRVFRSVEGWGYHFMASAEPTLHKTAEELASKLPPTAARDLLEWGPFHTPEAQFQAVVEKEIELQSLISPGPVLTDDRPINEYYFLRRNLFTIQN
jgi:spermidine synthase